MDLPDLTTLDWVVIRRPISELAIPLVRDLGPGETEVLMLALESPEAVVVVDDALARHVAETLGLRLKGTLGLLLDAKRAGLILALQSLSWLENERNHQPRHRAPYRRQEGRVLF
jgi:predicted nucleic acid-binding protein